MHPLLVTLQIINFTKNKRTINFTLLKSNKTAIKIIITSFK